MNPFFKKLINPFRNIINKFIIYVLKFQRLTTLRDFKNVESYRNEVLQNCSILFDVGACSGNYIKKIEDKFSKNIFLFEPDELIYVQLKKDLLSFKNVKCYNIAFLNTNCMKSLNCYTIPELNSFAKIDAKELSVKLIEDREVVCKKLDDFVEVNGISHIDMLNIDTNGSENQVIAGAHNILSLKKVKNIEISYISPNIYKLENNQLSNLLNSFDSYGYKLDRIFFKPIDFEIIKYYLFFSIK